MNTKQKTIVASTALGALAAETTIGTLGVTLIGTAVAVPAAAVIAVGGVVALAATIGEPANASSMVRPVNEGASTPSTHVHYLRKGESYYRFIINKQADAAQVSRKRHNSAYTAFEYFSTVADARVKYQALLDQGFKAV